MVYLTALWLPILLSAMIVFIASAIVHMVLPIHRNDYKKLPNEENLLKTLRKEKIAPADYAFPFATPKDLASPEMIDKYKEGPVGLITVIPNGPPAMGKQLAQWFIYCLVISVFVAYLTGRTLTPGVDYLSVFRVAGAIAFLSYSAAHASNSIWKGQSWMMTLKQVFDGLIYGLLTAGTFAWLWPA